jgi:hypothetical protein
MFVDKDNEKAEADKHNNKDKQQKAVGNGKLCFNRISSINIHYYNIIFIITLLLLDRLS